MRLGALEAGGTKMVCAVGDENGNVFERESFPTRMPEDTMPAIIDYFKDKGIEALGIGSFGPLNLDPKSPEFGNITTTPKPGWANYPLRGALLEALHVPVGIDTDVNAAALAEARLGAGKGLDSLVYYTIGTGIGGGALVEGRLLHGLVHPEMGHILLRPDPRDPAPHGFCPYHDGCLEGMANGPAIEKRWGKKAIELKDDPRVWDLEAYYLAQAMVTTTVMLSPKMIILGGGVMHQEQLFQLMREKTAALLNDYLKNDHVRDMNCYIVPASLHDDQGIMGCLKLGFDAAS